VPEQASLWLVAVVVSVRLEMAVVAETHANSQDWWSVATAATQQFLPSVNAGTAGRQALRR